MTIRPIDLNGMIQRTQDVGQIKQQEDIKPAIDQQNMHIQAEKQTKQEQSQVVQTLKSEEEEFRYDAKDGNGSGQQGKKRKKKREEEKKDKVVIKGMSGGFDIKI